MPTPVRTQYLEMKARHPGALLLFRMGDFYETFDEDARIAARDLEIVLTQRDMGGGEVVPLAGIPYHALDAYLGRLIRKGHRVAICEQVSEPDGKRLVERDVVRVVTPGTVLEPGLVEEAANTYLAAVALDGERAGVAHADVSTGEFAVTELPLEDLARELARLDPREVLVAVSRVGEVPVDAEAQTLTPLPDASFAPREARRRLLAHFGVSSLDAYGCESMPLATAAAAAVVDYLGETHRAALALLTGLRTYATGAFMALDPQTRRNLELFEAGRWGARTGSLLSVLDRTRTPMGARALRRWLGQPLLDLDALRARQEAVAWLHASGMRREGLGEVLAEVTDMERAVGRAGAGAAAPRELAALRRSLQRVTSVRETVAEAGDALAWLAGDLDPCAATLALLTDALEEEPQGEVGGGKVVRAGFNAELDELRDAARDARSYIAGLERRERERTGIASLKVGYNRVFGYYLEVTNAHRDAVPEDYIRRQTLANAERYYTPELKEHESRVLNAGERLEELEQALYRQVCRQVADDAARVRRTAGAVAALDVFTALADAASRHGYVRPTLDEGDALVIRNGRHPVVERMLPEGAFVPNDTALRAAPQGGAGADDGPDAGQVIILTGPNMAGKSTYMRQVALIVLLAQVGSFVPADAAHVGLADRIFTRVGLQDDLAAGQSTFMVEMVETASILHHATRRSLVVLDEIGRGTSTYDGLSIAQAVAEHLHNDPRLGSRTLFATHYHELTALAGRLPRVRNHSVAVAEEDGGVVFLHRIVPGGADRSYGVHVAQLAGLPRPVVARAWELLAHHEQGNGAGKGRKRLPGEQAAQLGLFAQPQPSAVEEALRALDVNGLTPLEALNRLYELQQQARGEQGGANGRGG